MPRSLERLKPHTSELDAVAVVQGRERILGLGGRAQVDRRAGTIAQLEMTRDEVGVQVGQQDVFDREAVLRRKGEVLVDIPLGIDDGRDMGELVTDQVRRVGEAPEIELLENHERIVTLRLSDCGLMNWCK